MRTHPRTAERILQRLEFVVRRRLDGRIQGDHRTSMYGAGLDFADLREYQLDDDVRRIDWNVTARLDEPHVRTYLEDRDVTAWFVIDRSASMQFGSRDDAKSSAATEFVAAMAQYFVQRANRVGAVLYNGGVERFLEASTDRQQVLRLTEHLIREPQGSQDMTDLSAMLDAAARVIPQRSVVFVVSDFLTTSEWQRAMRRLGHRHDVVAVAVDDPAEQELPDAGLVVVEDSETGEQLTIDASDPELRRRFREATAERRDALETDLRRCGVDMVGLRAGDDALDAVVMMAARRKRRR